MNDVGGRLLDQKFFDGDAVDVAEALIGVTLLVNGVGASSSRRSIRRKRSRISLFAKWRSALNESMYLPGGMPMSAQVAISTISIFVCREIGFGSAVLIRALRPTPESIPIMKSRRDAILQERAAKRISISVR